MASRIAAQSMISSRPASLDDLKHVFERAVGEIHREDMAARKLQPGTPIVSRARMLGISQANAEKQALSDAARALAQLWKV
jgi:hypothetical protein